MVDSKQTANRADNIRILYEVVCREYFVDKAASWLLLGLPSSSRLLLRSLPGSGCGLRWKLETGRLPVVLSLQQKPPIPPFVSFVSSFLFWCGFIDSPDGCISIAAPFLFGLHTLLRILQKSFFLRSFLLSYSYGSSQ